MNQKTLVQMADILPPPETTGGSNEIWIFILILLLAVFLTRLLWSFLQSPLMKISRQLERGTLSTRSASHLLSQHIENSKEIANQDIQHELDLMRFQPQSPTKAQVLKVIQRIKRHA